MDADGEPYEDEVIFIKNMLAIALDYIYFLHAPIHETNRTDFLGHGRGR
jgi:hypothetical protein